MYPIRKCSCTEIDEIQSVKRKKYCDIKDSFSIFCLNFQGKDRDLLKLCKTFML